MEFLTGFNSKITKPGFQMENKHFSITFKGISNIGRDSNIAFEECYDWTEVMSLLLKMDQCKQFIRSTKTSNTDSRYGSFEYLLSLDLATWLTTFPGWGILCNIIRPDYQEYFSDKLAEVNDELEDKNIQHYKCLTRPLRHFGRSLLCS